MIIAIDPGKKNLAWALLSNKGKLLDYGLVTTTFDEFKSYRDIQKGKEVINNLIFTLNSKIEGASNVAFVFERFVPRGRFNSGNLTEIINVIIGMLIANLNVKITIPLLAATWKNRAKKYYKYSDKLNDTLPQHIVDAYTLGLYFLEQRNKISTTTIIKQLSNIKRTKYGWKYHYKNGWSRP